MPAARKSWYACGGTGLCAGGVGGSFFGDPSTEYSCANWVGVSVIPTGLSGPVTCVNSGSARSAAVPRPSAAGSFHTGWLNRKIRSVGFAEACGKYLVSRAWPLAESVCAGAVVLPPKPAALYPVTPTARAPKTTSPASSVGSGCRTMRPAMVPQTPGLPLPWMSHGISFGRPNSAGTGSA